MSGFSISANYHKHMNSTEVKPSNINSVTVNNVISESPASSSSSIPPAEKKKDFTIPPITSTTVSSSSSTVIPPVDEVLRCAFERKFLGIVRAVIGNEDLRDEVIDDKGDIVLSYTDLTDLIKIVTGANDVEICIQEPVCEIGCIRIKRSPFSVFINRIIVNGMDFCVGYNKISTMMSNDYKISLNKVAF